MRPWVKGSINLSPHGGTVIAMGTGTRKDTEFEELKSENIVNYLVITGDWSRLIDECSELLTA